VGRDSIRVLAKVTSPFTASPNSPSRAALSPLPAWLVDVRGAPGSRVSALNIKRGCAARQLFLAFVQFLLQEDRATVLVQKQGSDAPRVAVGFPEEPHAPLVQPLAGRPEVVGAELYYRLNGAGESLLGIFDELA
jgi:hypothetical protein